MNKTGEKATRAGPYEFAGYADGSYTPRPASHELVVPMSVGETFPGIRSTSKPALWRPAGPPSRPRRVT